MLVATAVSWHDFRAGKGHRLGANLRLSARLCGSKVVNKVENHGAVFLCKAWLPGMGAKDTALKSEVE